MDGECIGYWHSVGIGIGYTPTKTARGVRIPDHQAHTTSDHLVINPSLLCVLEHVVGFIDLFELLGITACRQ